MRNIRKKLGTDVLVRFLNTVLEAKIRRSEPVTPEEEAIWKGISADKDLHVLAGALKAKADVLISHDRHDILTARVRQAFPIPVMTPGEFLKKWEIGKFHD